MAEDQHKKTPGIAIISLVLGCFFIIPFYGFIFGLFAAPLGLIAWIKISNNRDTLKGKGLAISGFVLGLIEIMLGIMVIFIKNSFNK